MDTRALQHDVDVAALLALIRANARGARFGWRGLLLSEGLRQLEAWAEARDVRVRVAVHEADAERVVLFGVGGVALGSSMGGAVGAAAGAVAGAALAHVEFQVRVRDVEATPCPCSTSLSANGPCKPPVVADPAGVK